MSFLRQGEIYPFDKGAIPQDHALPHPTDEFPAGYSLAGCTPAEPASASPAGAHFAGKPVRSTMQFHRTAGSVLTVCLSPGDHRKNRRERILTEEESKRYLAACPQPWQDVATVLLGTGMRPGEAYKLSWKDIHLNGTGGYIHIADGKTRAARRLLPMVPAVYASLKARHEAQGKPFEGWVFPTGSRSGHIEESSAKQWHGRALATLEKARKGNPKENPEVKPFEPYCLRHTALTWLAKAGCDAFTLARIAGHSNITITQRYVHPETEAIEAAFQKLVTYGGHQEKAMVLSTAAIVDTSLDVSGS